MSAKLRTAREVANRHVPAKLSVDRLAEWLAEARIEGAEWMRERATKAQEEVAERLREWMESLPLNEPFRKELSLRAGERYQALALIDAIDVGEMGRDE